MRGDESREDANEPWEAPPDRRGWTTSAVGKVFLRHRLHHHTPRSWRTHSPGRISRLRGGGYHLQEGSHGGQAENGRMGWKIGWVYKTAWYEERLIRANDPNNEFPDHPQVAVLLPTHTRDTSVCCCHRLDSPDIVVWRVALAFVEPPVERELVGVLALPIGHIFDGAVVDPAPRDLLPARLGARIGGGFLILGHVEAGQGGDTLDRGSLVSPCGLRDNHMV